MEPKACPELPSAWKMPPEGELWEFCCWWWAWNGIVPGKAEEGAQRAAPARVECGRNGWLATTTVAVAVAVAVWFDVDSLSV
jgi:hypothetical protein